MIEDMICLTVFIDGITQVHATNIIELLQLLGEQPLQSCG